MKNRHQQDARHREMVRAYYETGDSSLLAPMLDELRPRLKGFLWSKGLRDATLLADVLQDTILAALVDLRRQQYAGTGTVASWVTQIGWHLYCQYLKRKDNHVTQPGAHDDPFLLLALPDEASELPDTDELAQAAIYLKKTAEFVLRLDEDIRAVVHMCYFQRRSEAEAAQLLGIPPHLCRARLRQGEMLLESWGKTQPAPTAGTWAAVRHIDTGPLFWQPVLDG